ncbi:MULTISPECIES: carbonic anhydrase [Halorhodospira]|uniref:carbonic anhydrase n=1 Tax=Halorhodospira TaxID=85108 RepID=UPI001913268E|nr:MULTISPECIES: carbonic anhydrase [Halorhodospira]MBK5937348.1 carbonic anhydrase [Halorhodospira halophila]MCG5539686.1 carbonic anhydrase [Halorhodospira sp. M39old]MCG5545496.1 carbonic anhydrase [Halorhodospira sp. M38]
MADPAQALGWLIEGNQRFMADAPGDPDRFNAERRGQLVRGQTPFAAILSCADSRVPAEVVFDQGLGDLFVVRVAGNIAAPSQMGSLEFAAEKLGVRLVVVLGHSCCGAIDATVEALREQVEAPTEGLRKILDRVRPAVEPLFAESLDPQELAREAVRANVRMAAQMLREESPILARLRAEQGLAVVGAEYDLASGAVHFFDGVAETGALPPPEQR